MILLCKTVSPTTDMDTTIISVKFFILVSDRREARVLSWDAMAAAEYSTADKEDSRSPVQPQKGALANFVCTLYASLTAGTEREEVMGAGYGRAAELP